MKITLSLVLWMTPVLALAQQAAKHPDLSGTYAFYIDAAPVALKKVVNGKEEMRAVDQSARWGKVDQVAGALAWKPAPTYQKQHLAKVKDLHDHESKTDPVFYCGKPGTPRIGAPRRIVQLPSEIIFFYEDISGDPYRIIPTDGRKHKPYANPSSYGNSVGHWEGATLVVDSRDFVEDTWFGEEGYFHSDAMRVVERFWKQGANLVYQVTVEDPKVLAEPWTMQPHMIKPSTEPVEESPACVENDAKRLLNNDHHVQR
jgi:hypothetical protein